MNAWTLTKGGLTDADWIALDAIVCEAEAEGHLVVSVEPLALEETIVLSFGYADLRRPPWCGWGLVVTTGAIACLEFDDGEIQERADAIGRGLLEGAA